MTDYFDLGSYTRPVTTPSSQARLWVVRGLLWAYAFHHEEAVACFERAIEADPGCALAHWGVAYALGPNYNKPWETFDADEVTTVTARTHAAAAEARRLSAEAEVSGPEQALIGALTSRYPQPEPGADTSVWNRAYADAMRTAYQSHPDDPDVAVLFADALMNLTPWELWDITTGEPAADAATTEIRAVLERLLDTEAGRAHPGALHLYIHLMEMSPRPQDALWAGDLLRGMCPDAGHLVHMPTHLDVLCGDYTRVVTSNAAAIAADQRIVDAGRAGTFYTLYLAHNYHFKLYGAMFAGQCRVALETADALAAAIDENLLRVQAPPMADWLEGFIPMRVHVLVRFGRWQELIDAPLPADPELYCVTTAMLHYGKGLALAATGQLDQAREQRALLAAAIARVPESRMLFNNTCLDILAVATAMLEGELHYRAAEFDAAFAQLSRAVQLDDSLPFDEPWAWLQPARHAYGALLLEQGRVADAEAVYRADLGLDDTLPRPCQHPGNVWSLHGYHECLTILGKHDLAAVVGQQLELAVARADVPVVASCYCRLSAVSDCCGPPS